jgi:hypothetical protein
MTIPACSGPVCFTSPTVMNDQHGNAGGTGYMKSRITTLLVVVWALCLLHGQASAQTDPILISLTVQPPFSPDLSVWEANPQRVLIFLQNISGQTQEVRLAGFAESLDGGTRIETKLDFPTPCYTIPPGGTRTLNLSDFRLFDPEAISVRGGDKDIIARTRRLPEGAYRMCAIAVDCKTLDTLSPPIPAGCQTFFIRYAEPPLLTVPSCGQTIIGTVPQVVQFQWTRPVGGPPETQYEFVMVEIPDKRSPEEALHSATEPLFFRRLLSLPINPTTLIYTANDPPLQDGQRYAWRVRAFDPNNNAFFRNDGKSEACWFTFKQSTIGVGRSGGDTAIGIITNPILTDSSGKLKQKEIDIGIGTDSLPSSPIEPGLRLTFGCVDLEAVNIPTEDRPRFQVKIEQEINPEAVTGGIFEIWRADSRRDDPYALMLQKERLAYTEKFTGPLKSGLRPLGSGRSTTAYDLAFINDNTKLKLDPKANYFWRFTLLYEGKQIRRDGSVCYTDKSASTFGRFPDLIVKPKLPDTLVAGTFEIVVEDYDDTYKSVNPSLPSGIGRIKFDCNKKIIKPGWWKGLDLKVQDFEVVPSIKDSSSQLHLLEARYIEPTVSLGDKLQLILPQQHVAKNQIVFDRNALIDWYKKKSPSGIRVYFHDVKWNGPTLSKVILVDGVAIYPSSPPVPVPPAEVQLDSGFTLAIDSLEIKPSGAKVLGCVQLPTSIITNDTCTRARLCLPWTSITSNCELYGDIADGTYGRWWIGETGLQVGGTGYVVDFSSSTSPAGVSPSLPAGWKGVVLRTGDTPDAPTDSVISNRGYVRAKYTFSNALVTGSGFAGALTMSGAFRYYALDPYGYEIHMMNGKLNLAASAINDGEFKNGMVVLPYAAVRTSSMSRAYINYTSLKVQSDQDLYGQLSINQNFSWGEFSRTTGTPRYYHVGNGDSAVTGYFYLGARYLKGYYPLVDSVFTPPSFFSPQTGLEAQRMQGVSVPQMGGREFLIYTHDLPDTSGSAFPMKFPKESIMGMWMNVARTGVHTEIQILRRPDLKYDLGPTWMEVPPYRGDAAFKVNFGLGGGGGGGVPPAGTTTHVPDNKGRIMRFRFVESAVYHSELMGQIDLPMPAKEQIDFTQMMFTSTADNAGGQVDLSQPDTLAYWGVEMVAKDPSKSAGIVCVKLGVIYLTAAGLAEKRHFAKPFYLTWGEIKATGNMGRLFFDYNNVGQKFDRFPYTPHQVALSDYVAGTDTGFVHTGGTLSVGFFGAKEMSISDFKTKSAALTGDPFNGRWVRVNSTPVLGVGPSDLHWTRGWASGLADLDFNMRYDSLDQNGFRGTGTSSILGITGALASTIDVKAEGSCFSMSEETAHGFNMGPMATFSAMGKMWGCGCIVGETLEQIVVGGEVSSSTGAGFSLVARGAGMLAGILSYTPTRTMVEINGDMYAVLVGQNAEITGLAQFVVDRGAGYVEGYIKGTIAFESIVSGVKGEGELDWHVGGDFMSIQGRVAVGIYGPVSMGVEAGIFLGVNVPRERIWVTDGISGRFAFNKNMLPANVYGLYAFLAYSNSIDLFVVSGGYQVYIGAGAVAGAGVPFPGFGPIGNLGVRVWGEILGGLVSAAAWGNFQAMPLNMPPQFEGTIGLEACVLWVFCGSVDVTCGYNVNDGFYLY